jgi:creatinine amidohydrolase
MGVWLHDGGGLGQGGRNGSNPESIRSAMAVWELSSMDWEAVAELDRRQVVAILPTGALEAHGPHLPIETDVIIADAMARAAARSLAARGYEVLLLPALPFTPAPFAAAFPGTVSIRPETLTALVVDLGQSLAGHGIRTLAVANAHLDPAHLGALRSAGDALGAEGVTLVFPDITRRALAERLTPEFRSGACHAGRFETSIVLAARPSLVDDEARRTLPPLIRSLSTAIREGKRSFQEAGGDRAYFGDPAAATAEEGDATIAELGRILEEAVVAASQAGAVGEPATNRAKE